MARPKKDVVFDATDEVIAQYFDETMGLADAQKAASAQITDSNRLMQDAGVHSGTLSICRRLARMRPGKRGTEVALLHRYLSVLASRLEDPTHAVEAQPAGPSPLLRRVS
jgi:hypothetical protein